MGDLQHRMPNWTTPSLALAGLRPDDGSAWSDPRSAIEWVARCGCRAIQLDATQPGMRPRELDSSARRGVASVLRRLGLELSGLDLWIPPEHFARPDLQQRAIDAVEAAVALISDLRFAGPAATLSVHFPEGEGQWRDHLGEAAHRHGVLIADFGPDAMKRADPLAVGVGIDPAGAIEAGQDPAALVARAGPALAAVRLNDSDGRRHKTVGDGTLDLLGLGGALAVVGHAHPVIVDVRELDSPAHAAKRALTSWPPM